MHLYNIENPALRILLYLIVMPVGLMCYLLVILINSTHYGIISFVKGFIGYFKDNNKCLTYRFVSSAVSLAIKGHTK